MLASASLTWKYSAKTPSLLFENFQPPSGCPDCEEWPACEAGSPQSGVMAPTTTRSPRWNRFTSLPTAYTTPTASCPSVRFSRGPIAPCTVCAALADRPRVDQWKAGDQVIVRYAPIAEGKDFHYRLVNGRDESDVLVAFRGYDQPAD